MPSIVFICMANRYRSPIAAAAFIARLQEEDHPGQWDVGSAGTWTKPGLPALPIAMKTAREYGLDIEKHRSRLVSEEVLNPYDLVLVMEGGQKEALKVEFPMSASRVFLLSEVAAGQAYNISDPVLFEAEAEEIISEMVDLIRSGFARIVQQTMLLHEARSGQNQACDDDAIS